MVDEASRVIGFQKKEGDSLAVKIYPTPGSTNWTVQDSVNYVIKNSTYPIVKLKNGINSFTINSSSYQDFKFSAEYSTSDKGLSIISSNMPMYDGNLFSYNRWCKLSAKISEDEKKQVADIIKNEIRISDTADTQSKLLSLGLFLSKKLKPHEGAPSEAIKKMTPLSQYKLALSGKDEVDCANYADIFHLFANVAGIPTRKMGVAGWLDYTGISGHVFNESFIKEQGKWAMVDLTSNKLAIVNKEGYPLNTIELFNANISGFNNDAFVLTPDSVFSDFKVVPFSKMNASEKMHFKPTAEFYIIKEDIIEGNNFSENFDEYLAEGSRYGTYYSGNKKVDNSKHYFKLYTYKTSMALFYAWLFVLVIKLIAVIKSLSKRSKAINA